MDGLYVDLFWQQTLATLSASGKTILVGAGLPGSSGMNTSIAALEGYDFSSALEALRADNARAHAEPFTTSGRRDEEAYQNAVVIRGAHRGTVYSSAYRYPSACGTHSASAAFRSTFSDAG